MFFWSTVTCYCEWSCFRVSFFLFLGYVLVVILVSNSAVLTGGRVSKFHSYFEPSAWLVLCFRSIRQHQLNRFPSMRGRIVENQSIFFPSVSFSFGDELTTYPPPLSVLTMQGCFEQRGFPIGMFFFSFQCNTSAMQCNDSHLRPEQYLEFTSILI